MSFVDVIRADLSSDSDCRSILAILDAYASDPMGDGQPLAESVRTRLIDGLRDHPTTVVVLAMQSQQAVGIAVCFRGYSTFAARPLLNISDLYVVPEQRQKQLGLRLLKRVEEEAVSLGCCKLTLEVQENNLRARSFYETFGFAQSVYVEEAGGSLALSKRLTAPE